MKSTNQNTLITSKKCSISISRELKEKIALLGKVGDSYEDVIRRMYTFTTKNLLLEWLYNETDCLTIDEAIADLERRYKNGKRTL